MNLAVYRSRRPRVLVAGPTNCPALKHALNEAERLASLTCVPFVEQAKKRLLAGEAFDATLLTAPTPLSLAAHAAESFQGIDHAGQVITVPGAWFEGRLRFQNTAGDPSIVYWHQLPFWLAHHFGEAAKPVIKNPSAKVVLVASRDRDAATAIIDALGSNCVSVLWRPRGGRRTLISRVDTGVWVGGQLDGPATAELARFSAEMRDLRGRTLAMLDFPRVDEVATARAVGVSAVLAKPWSIDELSSLITQNPQQTVSHPLTVHQANTAA